MRHRDIIPDCPFPRGDPTAATPRVLSPAERWWIRTTGAGHSAGSLSQYFGVHPRTIGRIRDGEDAPTAPAGASDDAATGSPLSWQRAR